MLRVQARTPSGLHGYKEQRQSMGEGQINYDGSQERKNENRSSYIAVSINYDFPLFFSLMDLNRSIVGWPVAISSLHSHIQENCQTLMQPRGSSLFDVSSPAALGSLRAMDQTSQTPLLICVTSCKSPAYLKVASPLDWPISPPSSTSARMSH